MVYGFFKFLIISTSFRNDISKYGVEKYFVLITVEIENLGRLRNL